MFSEKQLQSLMKKMGIKTEEIQAEEVVIKTASGEIVIEDPNVTKVKMGNKVTFQITGEVKERKFTEEDVKLVCEKTGVDEETARRVLEETGDLAAAIMKIEAGP
ncbi:MAG: nascent polypeptide-associated complex protein [Candidatus Micrarchaeota archaeon]|nr:nascent polypeptide-associated complex protein [Candidatus Micrarchaeota archaeon]